MNPRNSSIATEERLVAHTRPLEDGFDLLDHLGPRGFAWLDGARGFVTAGVAATVDPLDASTRLGTIDHERDRYAPAHAGPRAVGALPFDGDGRLVIPARIVARDTEGRAWCTHIGTVDPPAPRRGAPPQPACFSVASDMHPDHWNELVREALTLIEREQLDKVVLARSAAVDADAPFDIPSVLRTLRAGQRDCVVYADEGFVGATPELLVRRLGPQVLSRPLAGTASSVEGLRASKKDAREHEFVVRAVVDALSAYCAHVRAEGPAAIQFTDVAHLATTVTARLRDTQTSALEIALALHPTPAVAGTPTSAALTAIKTLEPTSRGNYAGPCGWVDAHGDGEFVVALRCAEIDGSHARLHAGAGIVAGSDPAAEWAETQSKFEPMLRALVRP